MGSQKLALPKKSVRGGVTHNGDNYEEISPYHNYFVFNKYKYN